ncbi:hypothetical protein [Gordonia sp. NPDC003422]
MARRAGGQANGTGVYVRELLVAHKRIRLDRWPPHDQAAEAVIAAEERAEVVVAEPYLAGAEYRVNGKLSGLFSMHGERWFRLSPTNVLVEIDEQEATR